MSNLAYQIFGLEDTNIGNNIWDIQGNLILRKDGSVFAVYEVPSKIINSVDDSAKEEFKQLVYSVLANLRSYHNFEISMIPIDQDIFHKFEKLAQDIDWESGVADLAEYVLENMMLKLEESIGLLYDYKYYLTIPLKSIHISVDLKSVINQSYRKVVNTTLGMIGLGEATPRNWADKYNVQKEVLENSLSLLDVKAISWEENLFINRLQYMRGQFYDKDYEVKLLENSIENLDDVNIEFENVNVLKLGNLDQSSYIALLPVNTLPENVSYLHLQEELQTLRFPVESIFKCQFSINRGTFSLPSKARRATQKMKNAMNEADESDSIQKGTVVRSRYLLEDLQGKADEGEPLMSYLHTLIITASTIEELKSKYEVLYSHMNQLGVEIIRANADQVYLFYKNRLTEILNREDKNFIQSMSLEAFCENLFFMTRKVGTEVGFAIGRVDNQTASWQGDFKSAIASSSNPVYTNLYQANKLGVEGKSTSNPHVAIIGETGQGKSYLTKLLFTYHSLLLGKILYVDPKAEMREQYAKVLAKHREAGTMPQLQRYIESIDFVTLDAKDPKNYGVLDPVVFLQGQEAVDLADSMIDSLLGKDNNPVVQAGYLEAIDKVLKWRSEGYQVGMLHVFSEMLESDIVDVSNAGKLLQRIVQNSILSLCFSDGSNEAISLTNKITILEITGLDLPKDTNVAQELTKSQKKSLTVMYALGYFCKRFGERDRSEETIIFFDEAWFFNSTAVGRSILMSLKRIGRSFNNFMVYITQSVKDLDTTDDTTGFGTVFAFLEKTEIDDVLDYLKVSKTKRTRDWLGNMTMGQCIYYDTFNRRERITVEGMFPEIAELFDTVETKLKAV
ncbi:ATP-binding protein [Streptococcus merionis]|uniref:ATP-binding protein n=1 Tax=Streptococcus merionis TaxID=400065 RepID=UPI003514360E